MKKNESILFANATLKWGKYPNLSVCSSYFYFQIDNISEKTFQANKVPDGFQIPDQDAYTTRVYIEYKPDTQENCKNFIIVTKIRKIE